MKKTDLILLLLYEDDRYPIDGITKFHKLVFLVQKEIIDKDDNIDIKFGFDPNRFGPMSEEIYDEIEFLKSVDMIRTIDSGFEIMDKGVRFLEQKRFEKITKETREKIADIKKRFDRKEVGAILEYVYVEYPDFTITADILGKVLK